MANLPETVLSGRVYWVQGRTQHTLFPCAITNPPNAGWGEALLLPHIDLIFTPSIFQGYYVYEGCHELRSFTETETTKEKLSEYLLEKASRSRPSSIDMPSTMLVFRELELEFPFDDRQLENKLLGGQYPTTELIAPVNPKTRRGQALKLALDGLTIPEVMSELTASRRAVLSLYYQLHKFHGIGYSIYTNHSIEIQLPRGELWLQIKMKP